MFNKEILNEIDLIQESSLDSFFDVFCAIDEYYSKHNMIQENYSDDDLDKFDYVVQEGAIGDEMKKMKKDGESAAVSILAALPRFIAALLKVLTKKNEKTNKSIKELDTAKNTSKLKKLVGSVVNESDETRKNSILKKIGNILGGTVTATVIGGTIAGIVLHFKPTKTKTADGKDAKKTVYSPGLGTNDLPLISALGLELCITDDGKIAISKEFYDEFMETGSKINTLKAKKITEDFTEADEKLLKDLQGLYRDMAVRIAKFDGKDAKKIGLTGFGDIANRSLTYMTHLDAYVEKLTGKAIDKTSDKKVIGPAVKGLDHVIRGIAAFISALTSAFMSVALALTKLIMSPFLAVASASTPNAVAKSKDKDDDDNDSDKKDESEESADNKDKADSADADSAAADSEDEVKEESAVDEVPEGETVTQESTTIETTETSEPVDPVVSSWYSK